MYGDRLIKSILKYRLTSKLYPRAISTAHDTIQFDQTYQNGSLHCYQALTFDLERADTIKAGI